MAHFAEIDENNIIKRVLVIDNEHEANGAEWCADFFGGVWVQTSYNGNIRKNFAGAGFTYNEILDSFIPPRPFPSWVLDEVVCQWNPPTPHPDDGAYVWDEEGLQWVPL